MVYFIIPEPFAFPSGGNLYNRKMLKELEALTPVHCMELSAFRDYGQTLKEGDVCLIDTLYLPELLQDKHWTQFRCKKILLIHHLPAMETSPTDFSREEEFALRSVDAYLATSSYTGRFLQSNGFDLKPCLMVYPGIDFQPESKGREYSCLKGLLVANLIRRKGIAQFLEQLLAHRPLPAYLEVQIIGSSKLDPPYATQCLQLVQQLDPFVRYLGALSHSETLSHYGKSNIFISTASTESFGMALQEAVIFSLPILAVCGGNVGAHVRPGRNGQLFGNVQQLVASLVSLSPGSDDFQSWTAGAAVPAGGTFHSWKDGGKLLFDLLLQYEFIT